MIFLPEVSRHPSMQIEASRERSLLDESLPENPIRQRAGGYKKCSTQNISTEYKMRDGVPTDILRSSLSCGSNSEPQRKSRRCLRWPSEEIDYLKWLRIDGQRPWLEITRLFLDRYPGRSPAAIQVYCGTHGLCEVQDGIGHTNCYLIQVLLLKSLQYNSLEICRIDGMKLFFPQ